MPRTADSNPVIRLEIQGMHCASCVSRVERALQGVPGVQSATVQLATREAVIHSQSNRDMEAPEIDRNLLEEAVRSAGYTAIVIDEERSVDDEELRLQRESLSLMQRFIFSATMTLPVMILGMFHIHFRGSDLFQFLITTLLLSIAGREFFTKGIPSFVRGKSDMNSLVALGTGSAYLASTAATFAPQLWTAIGQQPHIYFEAACTITTFVLLGRWLEQRARREASQLIRKLVGLQVKTARVQRGESFLDLPIDEVHLGDIIQIRPGERIPVEGTVRSGESSVDESMMTGEFMPVVKRTGDALLSGTLNQSGSLLIEATQVGESALLRQIVQLVREAQASKASIARLADRISHLFVPAVLVIALFTFFGWSVFGPAGESVSWGLTAAIGVLIVACPCALGLAAPAAMMVAGGRGAELGILIRSGEAYEKAAKVNYIVLDKTGTITEGKPVVVAIKSFGSLSQQDLLRVAAAVESLSEHPLAQAVVQAASQQNLILPPVEKFNSVSGSGVTALVNGANVIIGNREFLMDQRIPVSSIESLLEAELQSGRTLLLVAIEGVVAGQLSLADAIKPGVKQQLQELERMGFTLELLTGDHLQAAQRVAQEVGIRQVRASQSPPSKLQRIRELQQQGLHVAMVGDGINDAPALAAADVGIALAQGTDIAIEAGDITILGHDLSRLLLAFQLTKMTMRTIHRNLFLAFIYNILCIPLAGGLFYPFFRIWLTPMWASAAMAASSVSVVLSSLSLKSFGPLRKEEQSPTSKPPMPPPQQLVQISLSHPSTPPSSPH